MVTKGRMATPQELAKTTKWINQFFKDPEMLAVLKRLANK